MNETDIRKVDKDKAVNEIQAQEVRSQLLPPYSFRNSNHFFYHLAGSEEGQ